MQGAGSSIPVQTGENRENRAGIPPCGHGLPPIRRGDCAVCPACGSFRDLADLRDGFRYDVAYPAARGHHDSDVGNLKVRTLSRFLDVTGISIEGLNVCEVGFGGGYTLAWMAGRARNVAGIESLPGNLDHAGRLGLDRSLLYRHDDLPARLPFTVDLWLFLDSFEHLDDPARFLEWMAGNTGDTAGVLLVAPDAGSLSARILGRWWPHRLPDHPFHWSRKGITDFFERHGYRLARSFHPWKYLSPGMLLSHAGLMARRRKRKEPGGRMRRFGRIPFRLNVGEMGLLFRKS